MEFSVLLAMIAIVALYFAPSIVAANRDHHQRSAIQALNLFLGWTLIGWVAALVWSLTATRGGGAAATAAPEPAPVGEPLVFCQACGRSGARPVEHAGAFCRACRP